MDSERGRALDFDTAMGMVTHTWWRRAAAVIAAARMDRSAWSAVVCRGRGESSGQMFVHPKRREASRRWRAHHFDTMMSGQTSGVRGCEDGDFWCALAHGRARAEEAWAPAPPAGTPGVWRGGRAASGGGTSVGSRWGRMPGRGRSTVSDTRGHHPAGDLGPIRRLAPSRCCSVIAAPHHGAVARDARHALAGGGGGHQRWS